ncbi:MAG: response regulator transcription factor [Chloroflexi bacterium]|nr:response regulator transcription factor [Chloroflexota bacterium]
MTIRIFLIDEHKPTREILARRLDSMPGLDVVGSTCNGEDGIREIAGLNPDVVLIETKMKQADGIDICRRALAADEQATIAVLTSYLDPDERRLAYQAGVDGYLLKDVDTSNLANWIKLAVQQEPGDESEEDDDEVD